jgi:hypothetical protein
MYYDTEKYAMYGKPKMSVKGNEMFMKGGILGDIYSIENPEQFKQIITIYNELRQKTDLIKSYYLDHNDNSVVFLTTPNINDNGKDKIFRYVESLKGKGFSIINFEKTINYKKYDFGLDWGTEKGAMIKQDAAFGKANPQWFKLYLISRIKLAKGGGVDEGVDLFEDYENIPANVQTVLDKYEDAFVDGDYDGLAKAHAELETIGYTFEYYLDGQAYDLRKIGQKGKAEAWIENNDKENANKSFAKGGGVKLRKGGNIPSIEKRVLEVNEMIKKGNELGIKVIDESGTWQSPMKYRPIKYSNGVLYVEYDELDLYKHNKGLGSEWKTEKYKVLKADMSLTSYGEGSGQKETLSDIAKMYRKGLKHHEKYGYYEKGGSIKSNKEIMDEANKIIAVQVLAGDIDEDEVRPLTFLEAKELVKEHQMANGGEVSTEQLNIFNK